MTHINLLALCGSLREGSLNSAVAHAAAGLCRPPAVMTVHGGLDGLPFFNPDVEISAPPAVVQDFRARLAAADAVLVASPEYARGTSGVLKNALEWVVGSGELVDKPVAVVTASPSAAGGERAQAWLRETLEVMSAQVLPESLRIPCASARITDGRVTDPVLLGELTGVVEAMVRAVETLRRAAA
ncbi:NADPH-dependent FMN reductase [Streptomyces cinnamoneus]|uniref:NADPH-dependent FMN reductase n=1 Tax=Streptomyces cinnamoneus TaxID=53446 RepID=UPI0034240DEE